jgi:hypothetical protein
MTPCQLRPQSWRWHEFVTAPKGGRLYGLAHARGFDGYKGHIAVDPDSEILTSTGVKPGNIWEVEAAEGLFAGLLPGDRDSARSATISQGPFAIDLDGQAVPGGHAHPVQRP